MEAQEKRKMGAKATTFARIAPDMATVAESVQLMEFIG